jgi:hypothetical protein
VSSSDVSCDSANGRLGSSHGQFVLWNNAVSVLLVMSTFELLVVSKDEGDSQVRRKSSAFARVSKTFFLTHHVSGRINDDAVSGTMTLFQGIETGAESTSTPSIILYTHEPRVYTCAMIWLKTAAATQRPGVTARRLRRHPGSVVCTGPRRCK